MTTPVRVHIRVPGTAPMPELMRDAREILANVARVRRGGTPFGLVHS